MWSSDGTVGDVLLSPNGLGFRVPQKILITKINKPGAYMGFDISLQGQSDYAIVNTQLSSHVDSLFQPEALNQNS